MLDIYFSHLITKTREGTRKPLGHKMGHGRPLDSASIRQLPLKSLCRKIKVSAPPNLLKPRKMATLCGLVGASGPNELQRIIVGQPRLVLYSTQVSAALRFSCMRTSGSRPYLQF